MTTTPQPQTLGELRDELGVLRDAVVAGRFCGSSAEFATLIHKFEFAVRDAAFEEVQRMTGRRAQS
jgi:hypothetical protein